LLFPVEKGDADKMNETITQGLTLMLAGMGTVMLFLTLMVSIMQLTGSYFKKNIERFREQPVGAANRIERISKDDSDEIAVIVAAITAYINK
jgi:sodium pump decarboxylase gamma subunit